MNKADQQAFTIRLSLKKHRQLKEIAFYRGCSMNDILEQILDQKNLDELVREAKLKYEKETSKELPKFKDIIGLYAEKSESNHHGEDHE